MESAFFLDVVIRKGPPIFQLLPCKDEALLIRGDSLLVLDLGLPCRVGLVVVVNRTGLTGLVGGKVEGITWS